MKEILFVLVVLSEPALILGEYPTEELCEVEAEKFDQVCTGAGLIICRRGPGAKCVAIYQKQDPAQ